MSSFDFYLCNKVTEEYAQLLGWKCSRHAIDKTAYDIPNKVSEIADKFIDLDKKVIKFNKPAIALDIYKYSHGITTLLIHKNPIKDINKTIIGILLQAIDISDIFVKNYQSLYETDLKFSNTANTDFKKYILTSTHSPLSITKRQKECLSLLIRGKPIKQIASTLGISVRTVETHIEVIKFRLGCYNKSQLIEKAIDSGFLCYLPKFFIPPHCK